MIYTLYTIWHSYQNNIFNINSIQLYQIFNKITINVNKGK